MATEIQASIRLQPPTTMAPDHYVTGGFDCVTCGFSFHLTPDTTPNCSAVISCPCGVSYEVTPPALVFDGTSPDA